MKLIMAGISYKVALVYLDDIVIFGKSFEEHLNRLDLVLGRLKEAGLKTIGVEVDPEKVAAVSKTKSPRTIKE